MNHDTPAEIVSKLEQLLEDERAMLLSGDLAATAQMVEPKEALVASLNEFPAKTLPRLGGLHVKMARNQVLLDGALDGIRKVTQRVAAIRKSRNMLETYDNTGQKTMITNSAERRVEKRA